MNVRMHMGLYPNNPVALLCLSGGPNSTAMVKLNNRALTNAKDNQKPFYRAEVL